MTALSLAFRFTPANGDAPRDIQASIEPQESERSPLKVTIDWGDGHPDRIPFPGPPLSGLELAARYVALRIRSRVEAWGGGTIEPEVEAPIPYLESVEKPPPAL